MALELEHDPGFTVVVLRDQLETPDAKVGDTVTIKRGVFRGMKGFIFAAFPSRDNVLVVREGRPEDWPACKAMTTCDNCGAALDGNKQCSARCWQDGTQRTGQVSDA